jgi:anti-sigma regulatory factor (Ser/Thr protein kinase)
VRRRLIETLESRGCAECLVDTAVLLATELLSNALKHARHGSEPLSVRLEVHCTGHHLSIAVSDPDPELPVARDADDDAEDGRGLALLQALATRWGALPITAGKTVWCLIS